MGAEFGEDLLRRRFDRARLVRGGASVEDLAGIDATDADFRQLFGALLRQSFDGIVLNATASRWILEVSDSFCTLTGYGRKELIGRTSVELGLVDADGIRAEATRRADERLEGLYEGRLRRKDGGERWVEFSHQLLGRDYLLTIVRDVSERRSLEADLRRLADTTRSLASSTAVAFGKRSSARSESPLGDLVTVLLIDVDRLKAINDEHGHQAGDDVLRTVAEAMRAVVRETDFVGRLGGDEFAVLLTRTAKGGPERVAHAFKQTLRSQPPSSARRFPIDASVGIAMSEGETTTFELLLEAGRPRHVRREANAGRRPLSRRVGRVTVLPRE